MASAPARKRSKSAAPPELSARLVVERKKLDALAAHPRNPRVHPAPGSKEWGLLKASLAHDYYDPLVWNKRNGMLVAGHLRCKVLADMGIQEADVVVVDYDEPTHIARMLSANKLIGHDDRGAQKALFGELLEMDFPLELTGFTLPELDKFGFGEDTDEPPAGSPAAESPLADASQDSIRYVQLIYTASTYTKFKDMLAKASAKHKAELEAQYGDDWEDAANVVFLLLEQAQQTAR
ncbi:hypothetical protein UFOVP783_32 [uncultured Caudovirales phage]|uniref:ParB/Sulfiredoxin n=1 Tax=uncultured Caudovirales phage TaxID=2100421 RepID=A0A6J5NZG3_9CAUD|nr:hypothetical protein UFOVP783_32 [uncultured Caudovirales phage]